VVGEVGSGPDFLLSPGLIAAFCGSFYFGLHFSLSNCSLDVAMEKNRFKQNLSIFSCNRVIQTPFLYYFLRIFA